MVLTSPAWPNLSCIYQGNRYITITDYFTNFVEEVPMKRKYFDNVAAALFKVVKHMHYDEVLKLIIY